MKEIIVKYEWIIIGICVLILFSAVKSCNDKHLSELRGQNKILKEQVTKAHDGVTIANKERLRLKDSIRLEDAKKEAKIKELAEVAKKSENKVKELLSQNTDKKKQIKNLTLVGVAKELNETYGGNNATAKESSIDIKNSMPYQILETIADANTCSDIIKEKDVQISVKDTIISIQGSQIVDSRLNLFLAEKTIKGYQELDKAQTDFNKSLEKENKKLRTKNFLNKVLIPVVAGAAFYGGYKIAK